MILISYPNENYCIKVYIKLNYLNLLFHIIFLIKFPDWISFILCGQVGDKISTQWLLTVCLIIINGLCIKYGLSTLNYSLIILKSYYPDWLLLKSLRQID